MECPLLEEVYEQYVLGVQESGCCAEMPLRPGCCTPDHNCKTRSYSSSYTQTVRNAQGIAVQAQMPARIRPFFDKRSLPTAAYLAQRLNSPYRARAALPDGGQIFLEERKLRT